LANDLDPDATYKGKTAIDVKVTSHIRNWATRYIPVGWMRLSCKRNQHEMTLNLDLAALADLAEELGA
jgi:hypothetical protein